MVVVVKSVIFDTCLHDLFLRGNLILWVSQCFVMLLMHLWL